jgi:arsenate reductase-like glutaredoxin family protein
LVRAAKRLLVSRTKQVIELDLAADGPTDDELAALILGPSGNLRAPAARVGDRFVVGFSDELFRKVLPTR